MIRWLLEIQCLNNDWSASAVHCFSISFFPRIVHQIPHHVDQAFTLIKDCMHGEMQKGHTVGNLANTKIEMCVICISLM